MDRFSIVNTAFVAYCAIRTKFFAVKCTSKWRKYRVLNFKNRAYSVITEIMTKPMAKSGLGIIYMCQINGLHLE